MNSSSNEGCEGHKTLEELVSRISTRLRELGFRVKRHEVVECGSIRHELDILAELNPLPDMSLKVGFKIINRDLVVDDVEKYIAWLDELPLDKLVLVTTGKVDVNAYELAKKFGIDIVRLVSIETMRPARAAFEEMYVDPRIDINQAIQSLRKETKSLFSKKTLESCTLVYLPLITIRGEVVEKHLEEEKVTLRHFALTFDGIEAYLVLLKGETMILDEDLGSFLEIPEDSITILNKLSEFGALDVNELAGMIGFPKDRLKTYINILASKSLVDLYGDLVELRYSIFTHSTDVKEFIKGRGLELKCGLPPDREDVITIPLKADINRLIEIIEAVNGRIDSISITYYPLYVGIVYKEKETEETCVVDGITGSILHSFSIPLSSIEIIDLIRSRAKSRRHNTAY